MSHSAVVEAYGARAEEYTERLGSVDAMHEDDRRRIESWAARVQGPILDAGCGPGHWTAYLVGLGYAARGIDPVTGFVRIAQAQHRGVEYAVGSFQDLGAEPRSLGGILAWYSLIHIDPSEVPSALSSLRDALRPGGRLLVGFFDGESRDAFDHAITPAWFWPVEMMCEQLRRAGFDIVDTEQRRGSTHRPHAAVHARA